MSERIVIRQNNRFETEFEAADPHDLQGKLSSVAGIHQLTPYGMLLAGLGSCTALVLHTYAQNHGLGLSQVELRLTYDRIFDDDCENCEIIEQYREVIQEEIVLTGDFDQVTRQKLYQISKQCPIHKMLESGVEVNSSLVEG